MNRTAYYLLLSSLASTALAACGGDDEPECPHTVITKMKERAISATVACDNAVVAQTSGMVLSYAYGFAQLRCTQLCADSSIDSCSPQDAYLSALEKLNGPAQDAGVKSLSCPKDWVGDVTVVCWREELRGEWSMKCPVAGRRPSGLVEVAWHGRQRVADHLARSAHMEAASVLAFEKLAEFLSAYGAPAQLVEDCREAARQEVRHAQVVSALSRARGAEPPAVELVLGGLPSRLELALENVVEGVVRECYAALEAIVISRTAAAADVRAAMASISADEASHAALSARIAAWLEPQLTHEERRAVAQAKRAAIVELRATLDAEPAPELREQLGIPSRTVALALLAELQLHVWRDGLPELAA
jgi:hypothetical protein